MLQKLFSSRLRVDLLGLFFGRPDEEFYVREIEKILGEDAGNISRELKNLESIGLLVSRKRGNLKYYLLDRKFPLYEELRSIILKTKGVAGVLRNALSGLKGAEFAFIYGSVAAGQETARSDIDLMVIGKLPLERLIKALKEPEKILGREISPSLYDRQEIEKRLREKEAFISRVMQEPKIVLVGEPDGLRELAGKRIDKAVQGRTEADIR
ncbi:MAG: nucleotidyltransferase domain-containing protein [Pseudomonadota bacterium]|jgi:predicted nucleotidyltransferase|nr:nucleotidyltransferase domain-containing protein [Pseudomonadota bacterium]NLX30935.1 ArsR family transcriptional regulator [Deltaproteobacteria bacterium]HNU85193.1 nucleotidyltransferase domain-containing protein [Syntrophales bacterium]HNZ34107.1 nucleotidyltransferase domain-containing protein [Syntrophales bacterium]HOF72734.1 nucleotidyltransferase domain-containing protein [Syntrophales bacterium]